jgi:hypothetical protein
MVAGCLKVAFCTYLIVSVVRAVMLWNQFTCSEPIQAWLVAHQLITLLLCLGHQLAHRIPGPINSGGLLPVQGNRLQKVVSFVVLIIFVPAFIASDVVGLVWFLTYSGENTRCWPSDVVNDPQVMALVLFGGCFWGFIYMLFGLSLVCNVNGLRISFLGSTERERLNRSLRATTAQQRSLVAPLQTLLLYCPEATCDKDCDAVCSICQEDCKENEKMRTVVVCGHQFHSKCLETWLRDGRPVCPNCQQEVTTPVEV